MNSDNDTVIKVVEQFVRRITFQQDGKPLSGADTDLLVYAFTGQFAIAVDLLSNQDNLFRAYSSFLNNNTTLDMLSFGRFLKVVDGVIKNYMEDFSSATIWDYKRFKHACDCDKAFWDFVGPIKAEVTAYLIQPSPTTFFIINQWLNFIQRCNLRSLDLEVKLENEYVIQEAEMQHWTYDTTLISRMRDIITDWCSDFSLNEMEFKHGPGSIAEIKGRPIIGEKYAVMSTDTRLNFLEKYIGAPSLYSPFDMGSLSRVSSLVCVPKSLITQRTISKEPASLQFFQQGVMNALQRMIRNGPLSRHIALDHQELSRDLARLGSKRGNYATIDLSNASDSVTVRLVKAIFSNTIIRNFLICTRSDATLLPSGNKLTLEKFAPMGSSVCFPIETIVFAACCELAVQEVPGRKLYYRVYGDDIVIDRRAVNSLLGILAAFHFSVNEKKSFWKSSVYHFREACGGEYLNGVDVAPLRIPRKFDIPKTITLSDAEITTRFISLANRAFDCGYSSFRRYTLLVFRQLISEKFFLLIPFSLDGSLGLKTHGDSCTNYRLVRRFHSTLYRLQAKCIMPIGVVDTKRLAELPIEQYDDSMRYFEWLLRASYRSADFQLIDAMPIEVRPSRIELRRKWALIY